MCLPRNIDSSDELHDISGFCLGISTQKKILYTPLPSPIRATCPAYLFLLYFITRTILGEECRSLSSSLCRLLHCPVTSPPIYSPHYPILKHLQPITSLNVSDQVSHPYKTRCKITFLYNLISVFLVRKLEDTRFCTK